MYRSPYWSLYQSPYRSLYRTPWSGRRLSFPVLYPSRSNRPYKANDGFPYRFRSVSDCSSDGAKGLVIVQTFDFDVSGCTEGDHLVGWRHVTVGKQFDRKRDMAVRNAV